jgi:hypothetical protein
VLVEVGQGGLKLGVHVIENGDVVTDREARKLLQSGERDVDAVLAGAGHLSGRFRCGRIVTDTVDIDIDIDRLAVSTFGRILVSDARSTEVVAESDVDPEVVLVL